MWSSCLWCALLYAPDVVELKDGTRLVGEIVADKGSVELRTPVGMLTVPAIDVARAVRRADLVATHRSLAAGAGEQTRAWLTIAAWSLEHGLYPEAFDAADRAEALAPRDPAIATIQDLLARDAVLDAVAPAELPPVDARVRLLERVSGRSPSRAAFARAVLARVPADDLEPWLLEKLHDSRPETRCGAATTLGTLHSDRALAQLIRSSLIDEHAAVRASARAAAAVSRHPDLAAPYLKALTTGDARMRERAYPMLETLRDPRAVPALIDVLKPRPAPAPNGGSVGFNPPHENIFVGEQRAYVRDYEVEIAQGAVIAKPVVGVLQSGSALDVKVAGVVVVSYVERVEVVSRLRRLTGQNLGMDPLAWETWWAASGGRLPPVDRTDAP